MLEYNVFGSFFRLPYYYDRRKTYFADDWPAALTNILHMTLSFYSPIQFVLWRKAYDECHYLLLSFD